jgi:hypothetical protein
MIPYDELRRRNFELECALGEAIKLAEQARDQLAVRNNQCSILSDIVSMFSEGLKSYMATMNKNILLNLADSTSDLANKLNK